MSDNLEQRRQKQAAAREKQAQARARQQQQQSRQQSARKRTTTSQARKRPSSNRQAPKKNGPSNATRRKITIGVLFLVLVLLIFVAVRLIKGGSDANDADKASTTKEATTAAVGITDAIYLPTQLDGSDNLEYPQYDIEYDFSSATVTMTGIYTVGDSGVGDTDPYDLPYPDALAMTFLPSDWSSCPELVATFGQGFTIPALIYADNEWISSGQIRTVAASYQEPAGTTTKYDLSFTADNAQLTSYVYTRTSGDSSTYTENVEIEYDSDGRISVVTIKREDSGDTVYADYIINLTYDADHKLEKLERSLSTTLVTSVSLVYDGAKISTMDYTAMSQDEYDSKELSGTATCTYDDDGYIKTIDNCLGEQRFDTGKTHTFKFTQGHLTEYRPESQSFITPAWTVTYSKFE